VLVSAFNIDYAPGIENYPHSAVNSAAPTRPPSRTSIASTQAQAGDAPIQSMLDLEGAMVPRSLLRRWEKQLGVPRSSYGPLQTAFKLTAGQALRIKNRA
jgi:hypothetical protein